MHVDIELQRIDIMLTEGRQEDALRQLEKLLAHVEHEERARIREALLDKGIDFLVDEIGADSLRGEKWQRFVDRICPKEPSNG